MTSPPPEGSRDAACGSKARGYMPKLFLANVDLRPNFHKIYRLTVKEWLEPVQAFLRYDDGYSAAESKGQFHG